MTAIIIQFPSAQKLMPWYISNSVKMAFAPAMLALNVHAVFWETWHSVFREVRL